MMVMLLAALILDLNLKSIALGNAAPNGWLNRAFVALAYKLQSETAPAIADDTRAGAKPQAESHR